MTEDPFAPSALDLVRWAETLSAVARTGLGFTQSLYERERFEEVLKVAADIRAAAVEEAQAEEQFEEWLAAVGEGTAGYVTPKVAVAAVVGNEKGEILLTQRADSGMWLYPVGYADPGYSPSEIAVKEVYEETGIEVEPESLIRGARRPASRIRSLSAVLAAVPLPDARRRAPRSSARDAAVGFFGRNNLPWPLAGANRWVDVAFNAIDGNAKACDFDPPRTPPWRA